MNSGDLLALYDRDQRRDIEYHGYRREATPALVRHVDLSGRRGFVLHSSLVDSSAEGAIREQIAYFDRPGQSFEWKVFDHDTPADLRTRLVAHGFEADEPEAVMVLDLETAPAAARGAIPHEVRRVTNPSALGDLVAVQTQVWGGDRGWIGRQLADELRHDVEGVSVYVAYDAGVPVSAAWIHFTRESPFANLRGGSTLPSHRGRGFYSALLAARVEEARRRGVRYLIVDARAMSRPILARFGFQPLCVAHACVWQPTGGRTTIG